MAKEKPRKALQELLQRPGNQLCADCSAPGKGVGLERAPPSCRPGLGSGVAGACGGVGVPGRPPPCGVRAAPAPLPPAARAGWGPVQVCLGQVAARSGRALLRRAQRPACSGCWPLAGRLQNCGLWRKRKPAAGLSGRGPREQGPTPPSAGGSQAAPVGDAGQEEGLSAGEGDDPGEG